MASPVLAIPPHLYEYYNTGDNQNRPVRGTLWRTQTFTPAVSHEVYSVKLKLSKRGNPGSLIVSIRATSDGQPTGADLCSGVIDGNSLTTSARGAWYEITLDSGYSLSAGTMYAIVARAPDGDAKNLIRWRGNNGGTYDGGHLASSGDGGISWTIDSQRDMMFEEWGNRAPTADPQSGLTVNICGNLTVTLMGSDPDDDALTYKISALASHGNLYDGTTKITAVPYSLASNEVVYCPTDTGPDSFGFKVNDGMVDSTQATISLTVGACDYLDGWYEDGNPYTACNGTQVCTYQDMVYLDYECVGGDCVPTETGSRTDLIGCESCDDGDPCTIDTCVDGECVHTPVPPPPVYPTVTTQAATGVGISSATLNMNYTVGNYTSVDVCFVYKKSTDSAWSFTDWVSKEVDGTHTEVLTGLASNTKYDFKAQLKYNGTVIEGTTLQFTTGRLYLPPSQGLPPCQGCFIATAAYGTPTAEQINVLREFRDVVLLKSTIGSQFVALYYQFSPPIADFIAGNELLRALVRELLVDPIVWVVEATGDMWRN